MLNQIDLHNFGPLTELHWPGLGRINLLIGPNDSGKTFLLKAIYCAVRTLEAYQRGKEQRSAAEILTEKLYWTFQPDKIGDLVTKGAEEPLTFAMQVDQRVFRFGFGRETTKQIGSLDNDALPRESNSIFLPAKEVLSLHDIILKSREQDQVFGFDDTYFDLARALRPAPRGGKNYTAFAQSRRDLETLLGGKVEYEETANRWRFRKGNQRFPIGLTAEGVKKVAILDTLLGNRFLDTGSLIFIDEPESALHPAALHQLMVIIARLAERGLQFFLASHSYFVVKQLFLLAQQGQFSLPILISREGGWETADLRDGIPPNAIVAEAVRLYQEEVDLALA